MVSFERTHKIMEILAQKKFIATSQLEDLLFCSTSTLRRDLIALEKEGKIIRSHGEIHLVTSNNIEHAYSTRTLENSAAKKHIAEIASTFLAHNQSIFIDSSSTAACLIPYFEKYNNLRIITNGIVAATHLNCMENISLFLSGGYLGHNTSSVLGDFALDFIDNFHADLAFFSCRGLDRYAAYEADHNQARIKQKMIQNADNVILLADNTKFNTSHYFKLANYQALDYIITNEAPLPTFENFVNEQCELLY